MVGEAPNCGVTIKYAACYCELAEFPISVTANIIHTHTHTLKLPADALAAQHFACEVLQVTSTDLDGSGVL